MKQLQISKTFSLPADAITQTFGILAIRGAGKTYTGKVLAEELQKTGGQVVCLDPTGVMWGLTSSADGKSPGLPFIVIGGEHGNVPLESTAGKIIARFVVESKHSVILDVSDFSGGELIRFMTDFASDLFHLKARDRYPLHLMIDEADTFAPQRPFPKEAQMLGAMEKLVKQGRSRGIGCTLITQRPATLNKNVLTQIETLIVLRMTAPRDRKAIDEWVEAHGTPEERKIMMESLASLPNGTAWFWSPSWARVFEKVAIRKLETFDSSATPDAGTKFKSIQRSEVDITALSEEIKATIEKAKANDPAELKRQIAELKKEKSRLEGSKPNAQPDPKGVQKLIDRAVTLAVGESKKEMNTLANTLQSVFGKLQKQAKVLNDIVEESLNCLNKWNGLRSKAGSISGADILKIANLSTERVQKSPERVQNRQERIQNSENRDLNLGKCERAILAVLATRSGKKTTKTQAAILSGYSSSSGGFNNSLGKLRSSGYIEGGGDDMKITELGFNAIGDYEELPTGEALWDYWKKKLGKCEREILSALIAVHPNGYTKDALGEVTGYSASSGGFNNSLGKLRTLELINRDKEIKASDSLFE